MERCKKLRFTEGLGREKQCARCLEWWPADEEFFKRLSNGRLHSSCRACCSERKGELRHGAARKGSGGRRARISQMEVNA